MMMPKIFGENLFDDFMRPFDDEFMSMRNPLFGKRERNMMKTDIKEKDGSYILDMDLPGFKKEDISLKLENGYITVGAQRSLSKDEKDDSGNYIRRERYSGSCSRSFYVGENVEEKDIKAKFDSGILHIEFPSDKYRKPIENRGHIAIEG
ncbi:Hsp20/alpha crystallin family protein [Lachnospiraceae bacterium NSJ-143]|nr:Hsp20/alpha crystallin family protein [Lachnospiraceae bacterium NSJ-143]